MSNVARESEVDARHVKLNSWFKSTFSGDADCCVEVKMLADGVLVRDTKFNRDERNVEAAQPVLAYTVGEWQAFVAGVKAGQFDR